MNEIDKAIAAGNCIGCGACAFAFPSDYGMRLSFEGHFEAQTLEERPAFDASPICPMVGISQNETEIAEGLFPDLPKDEQIGKHLSTFASHVMDGSYRDRGGSGGLVTWLAVELLRRNLVDAVIHVKPAGSADDPLMFRYAVSDNIEEVMEGAKSRYYPIEMSGVLQSIQGTGLRYLVIGLPCFVKAIRLMQNAGLITHDTVPFCVGLVCGHLKSHHFAGYLSAQKGSGPDTLTDFDFRHKIPGRRASDYGFTFRTLDAPDQTKGPWPMTEVNGKDWGEGQFKNPACEFCDDVLAECADIAIGDAWLPNYVADYRGNNIVVTRNKELDTVLREGHARGAISLDAVDVSDVIQSQASGLRHRREGLAHRLARRKSSGVWRPTKRVVPTFAPDISRRMIYDLRLNIAANSSRIFAECLASGRTPKTYERRMARYIFPYKLVLKISSLAKRVSKRLRNLWRPI